METSVYIDEISLDFEDSEGDSTLGDLVGAVEYEIKPAGRFVDSISVDGESLTGWRGPEGLGTPLAALGEVKMQTASFAEVAAEGVSNLMEYSGVIRANINSCAASLRRGGPAGAELNSIVEGVIEVVKTIEMLSMGAGAYGTTVLTGDPSGCCSGLLASLEELSKAAGSADSVSIADILEYELSAGLEEVERLVSPAGA